MAETIRKKDIVEYLIDKRNEYNDLTNRAYSKEWKARYYGYTCLIERIICHVENLAQVESEVKTYNDYQKELRERVIGGDVLIKIIANYGSNAIETTEITDEVLDNVPTCDDMDVDNYGFYNLYYNLGDIYDYCANNYYALHKGKKYPLVIYVSVDDATEGIIYRFNNSTGHIEEYAKTGGYC